MEGEIGSESDAIQKRKYMSFRSIVRALWKYQREYLSVTYCWHRCYVGKQSEPFPSLSAAASLLCSPSRPAISPTTSSAKIVSIRIQMRPRSHHATRHIPLRHFEWFDATKSSVEKEWKCRFLSLIHPILYSYPFFVSRFFIKRSQE